MLAGWGWSELRRRSGQDPDLRPALRRGLLGSPGLLFIILFLLYPLVLLIELSFQTKAGFGFDHYARLINTPVYAQILWKTAWISAVVTVLDFLIGYPLAVALARATGWARSLLLVAILMPFWTNLLVRAYGWIVVLHPRGMINTVLTSVGAVTEPLALVHNTTGVFIGMTQIMLPYMVLPIAAQIEKMDSRLI